ELECLFEREHTGRDQPHELLGGGGSDVGQLLRLRGVYVEVVVAGVLADDHSLVELVAGGDEERAALLQIEDRVAGRLSAAVGDEAAGRSRPQFAVPRLPRLQHVVGEAGPARLGQELGSEADQPPGGDEVLHPRPAAAVVHHLLQAAFLSLHKSEILTSNRSKLCRYPVRPEGAVFSMYPTSGNVLLQET